MNQFDCVVVGGGMVGAASALSLAELGLKIAIIEKSAPKDFTPEQAFDLRVSAISIASEQLLKQLDVWQQLQQWRMCPYERLGVWESEQSYTEFNATDIKQTHLGHIIENRLIQLTLWQKLQQHSNITLLCPETLISIEQSTTDVELTLSTSIIKAKVVIGADGANSYVRKLMNIGTTGWDYAQSAMLINVKTEKVQQNITAFPLTRRHANQYHKGRVLLIGDAAHTINPMAGQGVNLGFKDVKALQHVIAKAIGNGESWHEPQVLRRYQQQRRTDNLLMMTTMDALYLSFSHISPLAKLARNAGLMMVDKLPNIKNKALAYACGI